MKKNCQRVLDVDLDDLLVLGGLICLALAVWLALGWVGVLGFLGSVMVVIGFALARGDGRESVD